MREPPAHDRGGKDALALVAVGALAIACCAGLPLFAALAGGVTATTLLGVGGGIVAALLFGAVVAYRVRTRRRSCETGDPGNRTSSAHRPSTTERI